MSVRAHIIAFFIVLSHGVMAQIDSLQGLLNHFSEYKNTTLHEKLFVHTDRSFYLTGETMWFAIYDVDASFNRPVDVSKVAYLEILDRENKAVLQVKIALKNGKGDGYLYIPSALSSGNYQLRCYTQWMRNFSAELYYHQPLTIFNPFVSLRLKPGDEKTEYDAQFFPEGGNLVAGLESRVAFRVVDKSGKGIEFTGAVIGDSNDTITRFHPLKFGIGSFRMKPSVNHYRAVIRDSKGRVQVVDLPTVHSAGYVVTVRDTTNDRLFIRVASHVPERDAIPYVYMLIHSRLVVAGSQSRVLSQGQAWFMVDKKKLREGVSHITIFNDQLTPVCERLYFRPIEKKLVLSAQTAQGKFNLREKIDLNISAELSGKPVAAGMSVAVVKSDSSNAGAPADITSYLALTSELRGHVESPEYYLSASTGVAEAADNLMLSHGWSRFRWEDVMMKKAPPFIPEHHSHILTALITTTNDAPVKFAGTMLSVPGRKINLFLSKSDENGRLQYEVTDFFGSHRITVQAHGLGDQPYSIKINSPFSQENSSYVCPEFNPSSAMKKSLTQRSLDMQLQNIFYDESKMKFIDPGIDSVSFYGSPDEKYMLDDYTRFPTMEEVMREYVPGIQVRKRKGDFHFITIQKGTAYAFKDNPLVLLDGIPVESINKIMAYDPRKVQRLDVMTQKYFIGHLSFEGLVSYTTYHGDFPGYELDPRLLSTTYEGLQQQREFFSPRYETQAQRESRIPDARDLLFWSPSAKTDSQGKCQLNFYSSDVPGKYAVVVEGITQDGQSASATFDFEVVGRDNY